MPILESHSLHSRSPLFHQSLISPISGPISSLLQCLDVDSVYCVAINPVDETKVVSGGGDEVSYLWNLEDGEDPIAKLEGTHLDALEIEHDSGILESKRVL